MRVITIKFLGVLLILTFFNITLYSALDQRNTNLVGTLLGGSPKDVVVEGDYAYLAANGVFLVVDISDPNNPKQVSYCKVYGAERIFIAGNYACIGGVVGITLIDISDPLLPYEVSTYDVSEGSYAGIYGFFALDNYIYFISESLSNRPFIVLDISNPASPTKISQYDLPAPSDRQFVFDYDIYVSGNYAYIACGEYGLIILDVSNPASPTKIKEFATLGYAAKVLVSGNYAYVSNESKDISFNDYEIINISDVNNPFRVGESNTSGTFSYNLYVSSNYLYTVHSVDINTFDISISSSPKLIDNYRTEEIAHRISKSENYIYVANDGYGLRVLDVTISSLPVEVGSYNVPGYAETISIKGDYAYVTEDVMSRGQRLKVINISDSASPYVAAASTFPILADKTFISDNYLYAIYNTYNPVSGLLKIIDISNPFLPKETGEYTFSEYVLGIFVSGDNAYIANKTQGLKILNISNPQYPILVGSCDTPGYAHSVVVRSSYAYVADTYSGLRIIDISNPFSPAEIGSIYQNLAEGTEFIGDVSVSGNHAYLSCGTAGLRIVDISDPYNPTEISQCDIGKQTFKIDIVGQNAYLINNKGISVINFSNPLVPYEIGNIKPGNYSFGTDFFLKDDYLYLVDEGSGLWVFEFTYPEIKAETGKVKLIGGGKGYIQPERNEKLQIIVSPKETGTVNIKVFNVKGILLWEKQTDVLTADSQNSIEWACKNFQGDAVASGVYLVHVKGAGIDLKKKTVIIR
jgi:hypothetical protein